MENKLTWSAHPLVDMEPDYRALTDAEVEAMLAAGATEETILKYRAARETRIKNAQGYFWRDGKWVNEPDPLRYGFDLPHWKVIRHYLQQREEVYNFGGNDSGKTTLMGKLASEVLTRRLEFPGTMAGPAQVCCIAQNDSMSKRVQQAQIYKHLPVELRRGNESGLARKRSTTSKLTYSDANGFTDGIFTLANPRGAAVIFRNVTQFERNEVVLEGDGFHFIPVDESAPLALLDALRFRAAKKGGRILYCFTPVAGFDAVCNNVFTGARVLAYLPMQWDWTLKSDEWRVASGEHEGSYRADGQFVPKGAEAIGQFLTGGINPKITFPEIDFKKEYIEGIPPGHMPFVMQPLNQAQVIVFTWSHWNPFPARSQYNPLLPKIADKCVGRGHGIALMRLFGYTAKNATTLIPNFKPDYFPNGHLIKHSDLLKILAKEPHNLRCGADPATARSWFIGWKAVLPNGLDDRPMQYLVWESPTVTEGEWVTPDGERGDGQRVFAENQVDDYKLYIREIEAGLNHGFTQGQPDPVLRSGDPRGFAASLGDGSTKYFELFLRDDSAKDPRLAPMYFRPAGVKATIRQDVTYDGKLMDLLACDWDKPIDATNRPHLLISDACQNTIRCLLNCPENEPESPYKDGMDMTRYLFDMEIPYMPPAREGEQQASNGGAWT